MIRHRKGPGVIARKRVPSRCRPHYIMAYLWESQETLNSGASHPDTYFLTQPGDEGDVGPGPSGKALGMCCPSSIVESYHADGSFTIDQRPLIAEVHFVRDKWREEIVAHELCHAILHRLRVLAPYADTVNDQDGDAEEVVCHEFGRWFSEVWHWLWEVNAYGKNAPSRDSDGAEDADGE